MKILGIIPARYASSRFPGKPLIDIAGISMIERVYKQVLKASSLADVIVATDDHRIYDAVKSFNGNAIMTSDTHQSGTDRCAEVAQRITGFDAVINIQGDEPLIDPNQINLVARCFNDISVKIATLVKKIDSEDELFNFNTPKVLLNDVMEAIYFSRQTLPHLRAYDEKDWLKNHNFYKHIGIYGYETATLSIIAQLPVSSLEKAESLEQLRWIENGYKIKTAVTQTDTLAIDAPEDVDKVLSALKNN